MPCRCIVYGCRGNFPDGPRVKCFAFPSDEKLRKEWLKVLPLKHDTISHSTKVCELHFKDSDFIKDVKAHDSKSHEVISLKLNNFRLKKEAVPSRVSEYLNIDSEHIKGYVKKHLLASNMKKFQKMEKEDPVLEHNSKSSTAQMKDSIQKKYATFKANAWEKDEMSALIALYELEPCLYDKKDPYYYSQEKKDCAYYRIQQVMVNIRPDCTVPQIKNKIKKLRSQFSQEKLWKLRSIKSGGCTEETYQPSLWCYRLLHFLNDHVIPQEEKNSFSVLHHGQSESNGKDYSTEENILFNQESLCSEKDLKSKESDEEENEQLENLVADSTTDYQRHQNEAEINGFTNGSENSNNIGYEGDAEVSNAADENLKNLNTDDQENSRKRKRNDSVLSFNKVIVEENVNVCSPDKDDIFGQYIAEEMKVLREKPFLYARTKQSILKILTKANFEIQNLEFT